MNTKLRQKVRKPSKKEIGGAFVTLVLAALVATQGGYDMNFNPDSNQSQSVNNTDNVTDVNQSENLTDQNQPRLNATQNKTGNLTQPDNGNTTNTS